MKVNGQTHYLWRAVDDEGEVLEAYVTKKRNKAAALTFLKKAMKQHGNPKIVVTDKLKSYGTAMREISNKQCQETGQYLNNRAQNSHLPFRRRERAMQRFRRMHDLQKFASMHASSHDHFNAERYLNSRPIFKSLPIRSALGIASSRASGWLITPAFSKTETISRLSDSS